MKGTRGTRKICQVDDAKTYAKLAADPTITCGRCGLKAHDASQVCEVGIHSDVT